MPPPIPKGMRHDYLVSFAGALWSSGLSKEEVEKILWRALELLETLDDFDPVREIGNIVKGLQKWEGATYTIGSLLRMLPERSAGVVRAVLTADMAAGVPVLEPAIEPASAPESAPTSAPEGEPEGEPVSEPVGAESGQVASEGTGQDTGGQVADTGQSENGQGDKEAAGRLALAAEIVSKLEVRKGTDGINRYVYRTADGKEFEGVCAPEGVRDIFAKLGLKIPLKEIRRLLGIIQASGVGMEASEAKGKRGRKSKTAEKEDIKAILWRYKWVRWQGELWLVSKTRKLLRADIDEIHGLLKEEGIDVGKETLRSYYKDIMTDIPKDQLEGMVVTPSPSYGKVGTLRGLWFCHRGDLYLVTPNGWRVFQRGEWPEGVYALDLGMQAVLPDWDGTIEDLLIYWQGLTPRLKANPKVALAMFLPVLFGQGHIGLILRGPAKSGKSTLLKGLGYLHFGRKPKTPSGLNKRDLMAVLQRKQIVFFDEVKTFTPELEDALKRMITHDGDEIRALYTDLETVEADLQGSAVFCATNLSQLASDLRTRCFVWDLEPKGGGAQEKQFLTFCELLWRRALGGAIKLYQLAAKVKRPDKGILPEIRFRDWLMEAYRYAVVLDVVKEFLAFVPKSKRAAHKGDKYEFLLDAISHPDFDPQKEYKITDLFELAAPISDETKRLQHSLGRDDVRADLAALALDARYNLRIEKKCAPGDKRARYWFIFSPIEVGEDDFLASLLRKAGITPPADHDDDGDEAGDPLLPKPIPPTPTPPTHTTPPLTPPPPPPPPPDNTGTGAGVVRPADAIQDEPKTLTDIVEERKTAPSQLETGASAAANGLNESIREAVGGSQTAAAVPTPPSTSAQPSKTDPKKAPPPSEWVYRAGNTPQAGNGGVSDGLFASPQNAQPTPTPAPPTGDTTENTSQDDEYPTDDELIADLDERLRAQAEGGITLEGSLDFLNRFLLRFEEEMWQVGRIRSLRYIQNRVIELQNAIKALGYDEPTPENDPRLRPPTR
jgi:hypothetical protein